MAERRMLSERALLAKMKEHCPFFVPYNEPEIFIIEVRVNGRGTPVEQGFHVFGDIYNFDSSYQYYFYHVATALGEFRLEPNSLYQFQILSSGLQFAIVRERFTGSVSETSMGYVQLTSGEIKIYVETRQNELVIGTICSVGQAPFLLLIDPPEPQPFYPRFQVAKMSGSPGVYSPPNTHSWGYSAPQEVQPQIANPSPQYQDNRYDHPPQAAPQPEHSSWQQTPQEVQSSPSPFLDEDCDVSQIDVETYPQTSGEKRLPIKSLANCSKWNQQQSANALSLATKFTHWRRSRGDGNCYFRAVSVGYLEHLCRLSIPPIMFKTFYDNLLKQDITFVVNSLACYEKTFLKYLKELYNSKRQGNALQKLQEFLQVSEFDLSAVAAFRCIALHSLYTLKDHPDLAPFLLDSGVDAIAEQISTMGQEAEGVTFLVMANALDVKIVHTTLSPTACREDVFKSFRPGRKLVLHILLKPGHYDTLYSIAAQKADRYSYATNTFREDPSMQVADELWEA